MSLRWLFNKPKDFDCRECIHNVPCVGMEETKKFDACTHPKKKYYAWIERDTKSRFWAVVLGVCGARARRFKAKKPSATQLTLMEAKAN